MAEQVLEQKKESHPTLSGEGISTPDRSALHAELNPPDKKNEDKKEAASDFKRIYTASDPALGTLKVYGQTHDIPQANMEGRIGAGECQGELLKKLLRDKPQHIFQEGLVEDVDPKTQADLNRMTNDELIFLFPEDIANIKEFDDAQKLFLNKNGAVDVYLALHPEAKRHKVGTPEIEAKVDEKISKLDMSTDEGKKEYNKWVMDFREKAAAKEVYEFLQKHPGETVAMVYGSEHKYTPEDFPDKTKSPTIEFCKIHSPVTSGDVASELVASKDDSAKQEKIVNEAKAIAEYGMFALTNEKLVIKALDKLIIDTQDYTSKKQCKEELVSSAEAFRWPAAAKEIEKRFSENKPPFTQFDVNNARLKEFSEIKEEKVFIQNIYIKSEPNAPTQLEMVKKAEKIELESLTHIYDYAAVKEAVKKLNLDYYKRQIEQGAPKEKMAKEIRETIDLYINKISERDMRFEPPGKLEKYKALLSEINSAFEKKEGVYSFLK
jgi:hypothetical protein